MLTQFPEDKKVLIFPLTELGTVIPRHEYTQRKAIEQKPRDVERRGLKPIWACDVENLASMKRSEKLGFVNPVKYNFIFFPQTNESDNNIDKSCSQRSHQQ